jgi:hypothetical protein
MRRQAAMGMRKKRTQGVRIAEPFVRLRTKYRAAWRCLGTAA